MTNDKHPPLSEEQLAFFTEQTQRAVRNALRRYVRGAAVGFFVLVVAIIGVRFLDAQDSAKARDSIVRSGDAVAVSGCNRDFDTIKILRAQIKRGKKVTLQYVAEGLLTQAQADRAIADTNRLLSRYTLPDCRASLEIITDKPDAQITPQEPKYPGYRKAKG